MSWLTRVWERVREPRHLKAAYAVFYSITITLGLIALIAPPQSISGELGPVLTVTWGVLALIGGVGGLASVFPGWWFAERLSIVVIWCALGMYLLVVVVLQVTSESGARWAQMTIFALAAGLFYVRWYEIREYSFEPRR
ncbi:hypothetical protein [Microbacterium algeriense]|uniref:Uncharacterized protein n=1 Tax=Microbacterium algeriense TaxID=2615184 RepID=A0ABQ6VAH8_9MICO|nr:hypothetical protein [Microbacterium algeriense]KAB1867347.1 hypothetical protein F6A08_06050 [Microbacterium algeriense]